MSRCAARSVELFRCGCAVVIDIVFYFAHAPPRAASGGVRPARAHARAPPTRPAGPAGPAAAAGGACALSCAELLQLLGERQTVYP